jgi:hypothetical protein
MDLLQLIKNTIFIRYYLPVAIILIALLLQSISYGASLVWDQNSEVNLAGYRLYYGTSLSIYSVVITVGDVTEYELENLYLYESMSYFFALTAINIYGNESDFSDELVFTADDNISNDKDNCSGVYNPSQEDTFPPQANGIGDACDCEGNFDCDQDVDSLDVTNLLIHFGRNIYNNPCTSGKPCNGDFECDADVDSGDIRKFLEDFGRNQHNNSCPACVVGEWCEY